MNWRMLSPCLTSNVAEPPLGLLTTTLRSFSASVERSGAEGGGRADEYPSARLSEVGRVAAGNRARAAGHRSAGCWPPERLSLALDSVGSPLHGGHSAGGGDQSDGGCSRPCLATGGSSPFAWRPTSGRRDAAASTSRRHMDPCDAAAMVKRIPWGCSPVGRDSRQRRLSSMSPSKRSSLTFLRHYSGFPRR